MKIALIRPPATYADWYERPVLGLAYLASCIELNAFECGVFDAYFHSWSEQELLRQVNTFEPDVVGLTAMTHEIIQAAHIAVQLKNRRNIPVIVGGCHTTALPERTLEEFPVFDYGVYGEGEKTVVELLRSLEEGTPSGLGAIRGLVFRDGERIICNEPRPFLTSPELDALPYPGFHHYYGRSPKALSGNNASYTIASSRGCPYRCAFCMQVLGRQIRRRSAESVCQEIEYAVATYGAHMFDFVDEIFLFDCRETREVLELMIARDLPNRITWNGQTRANFVNPDLIALAKRAGCTGLAMGVESGDDGILKVIEKGITVEQVRRAVRIIKEAKIPLSTYFILGHPNETKETLLRTVRLSRELNTDTVAVGTMVPYPGTRVFDMARRGEGRYRLIAQDWSDYDKYGARSLELDGLPYRDLQRWQRRAVLEFYLRNFRLVDFLKYSWKRKRAALFLLKRSLARLSRKRT